MVVIFGGAILLNVIFPGRWWSMTLGFLGSALLLIIGIGLIYDKWKEARQEFGHQPLSANDQAVLDDFRNWASGGDVSQKKKVGGFSAYASRDKEMDRETGRADFAQDPVCSNCGTVYNREVVISLIKQESPEIFDFQTWTTKFVCKQCRKEIVISGGHV